MKIFFYLIFLSFYPYIFTQAQSKGSLTVFSETGDKFYLILDGVKQNDIAQAKIRIQELPDLYYSAKIIFKDEAIAPILKNNVYISDGDDIMRDAYYRIRSENGKAKLGFFSMIPVKPNPAPPAGTHVYQFGQTDSSEVIPAAEKKTGISEIPGGGSLTIFSQNGEKFYLFLDGVQQNEIAQSNIRIQKLADLYYDAKIVFKSPGIWPIVKNNLYISDGDDILKNASYRIRKDKAGRQKLNFFSMASLPQDLVEAPGLQVYEFNKPTSESGNIAKTVVTESSPSEKKGNRSLVEKMELPNATISKSSAALKPGIKTPEIDIPPVNIPAKNDIIKTSTSKTLNSLQPVEKNAGTKAPNVTPKNDLAISTVSTVLPLTKPVQNLTDLKTGSIHVVAKKELPNSTEPKAPIPVKLNEKPLDIKEASVHVAAKNDNPVVTVSSKLPRAMPAQTLAESNAADKNIATKNALPGEAIAKTEKPVTPVEKTTVKSTNIVAGTAVEKSTNEMGIIESKVSVPSKEPLLKKCSGWPMGKADLDEAKKTIAETTKDELKLIVAKVITGSNCLLSSQVVELCSFFKTEKTKLEFAKFAYMYTTDRKNYAEVSQALSEENSRIEFAKFLDEIH